MPLFYINRIFCCVIRKSNKQNVTISNDGFYVLVHFQRLHSSPQCRATHSQHCGRLFPVAACKLQNPDNAIGFLFNFGKLFTKSGLLGKLVFLSGNILPGLSFAENSRW